MSSFVNYKNTFLIQRNNTRFRNFLIYKEKFYGRNSLPHIGHFDEKDLILMKL